MGRSTALFTTILTVLAILIASGCSDGKTAVIPQEECTVAMETAGSQTHLWGFYECSINPDTMRVDVRPLRSAAYTANVVQFLNTKWSLVGFKINEVIPQPNYVDIDIDVSLTHPFPDMPEYNGYDVRGVFMGDGSLLMEYNPALLYADAGYDQYMLSDPVDGFGGPDGYTRWYNMTEFNGGAAVLSYVHGKVAHPSFNGTATVNPYKYFADGLGRVDDLCDWLELNQSTYSVFTSGSTNTRNYYLRFPNDKNIVYGYAVCANWQDVKPESHPSNAVEALACRLQDFSSVYYSGPGDSGGSLNLEFSLYTWHEQPSKIFIESTVLNSVYELTPSDMVPIGSSPSYSTYYVEIPADSVTGMAGQEFWVIAEHSDFDYSNEFGVPNDAENDPLAGFFRYDLEVDSQPNSNPVCDLVLVTQDEGCWETEVAFDASGSYDPDGNPIQFKWDFDGDGNFNEIPDDSYQGQPETPVHSYSENYSGNVSVKVTDSNGGTDICTITVDVTVSNNFSTKNIEVTWAGTEAMDIAMDHQTGDVLVVYYNGYVRRYLRDACYLDYETYYIISPYYTQNAMWIDSTPNGMFLVARHQGFDWYGSFYYSDGQDFAHHHHEWGDSFEATVKDIFAMGSSGELAQDFGFIYYHLDEMYIHRAGIKGFEYQYYQNNWMFWEYSETGPLSGEEVLWGDWMVAAEADRDDDCVWIVEHTDCVAARYHMDPSQGIYYGLTNVGPYFGVSMTPGDSPTLINDPVDLTRDSKNHMYLLDNLSTGNYAIKCWSYTESSTSPLGSFGSSADWNYTPVKIDGCDYNGDVTVLHKSGENAMISIFTDSEIPG